MNSVAETLRAARAKIADPDHWTKGYFARPAKRSAVEVEPTDPSAGAWCALGALKAVDGPYEHAAVYLLAEAIEGRVGAHENHVWQFNDREGTRHRDILRKFDQAIKLAEARQ